jgi:transcriptional regulator with XRE-family HTH domain
MTKKLQILLIEQDLNHRLIARRLKVSRCYVTLVLQGKKRNPKIRRRIGRLLGVNLDDYVPVQP